MLLITTFLPITTIAVNEQKPEISINAHSIMIKSYSDGIILNGTMGDNGWYISPVTITFTNENGSWVHLFLSIDDGDWFEYAGLIVVDAEGTHTVKWYYVDQWGNQSAIMTAPPFRIDMTSPVITLNYTWEGNPWRGIEFIFTATCTDAMSGMEKVEFYFNTFLQVTIIEPGPDYVWGPIQFPPCDITVKAIAYDNAGWTNSAEIINPHSTQSQSKLIQSLILRHHIMNLFLE